MGRRVEVVLGEDVGVWKIMHKGGVYHGVDGVETCGDLHPPQTTSTRLTPAHFTHVSHTQANPPVGYGSPVRVPVFVPAPLRVWSPSGDGRHPADAQDRLHAVHELVCGCEWYGVHLAA